MKINNWHCIMQKQLHNLFQFQFKDFCSRNLESLYALPVNHSHILLGKFSNNTEPFLPGLSLYDN